MKRILFTSVIMMFSLLVLSQTQSPYAGHWLGTLNAGGQKLRVGGSVSDSAGILSSFLMSPDQAIMRIEVEKTIITNDSLLIKSKEISASFKGKINETGDTLKGFWIQGRRFALQLARVDSLPRLNRPQEPKKPYPYLEEEISFTDAKTGIVFAGTLTLPQGQQQFPAVVLVSGSGPQTRDEALLGHKPFLVIADYLTRQGVAVLRYDDRGIAGSKGVFTTATTLDFADDAEAAFHFLTTDKRIDANRIGIIGHRQLYLK